MAKRPVSSGEVGALRNLPLTVETIGHGGFLRRLNGRIAEMAGELMDHMGSHPGVKEKFTVQAAVTLSVDEDDVVMVSTAVQRKYPKEASGGGLVEIEEGLATVATRGPGPLQIPLELDEGGD